MTKYKKRHKLFKTRVVPDFRTNKICMYEIIIFTSINYSNHLSINDNKHLPTSQNVPLLLLQQISNVLV